MSNIFWFGKNLLLGYDEDYLSVRVFFFFFFFFFFQEGSGACQHPDKVLNFIEILRFLGRCHWHSLKDRRMKFLGPPRYLLKTKTAKFQYSDWSGKGISR